MYTIIMNDDKSLSATHITKIYQREKLVDQFQFLFPQLYNNHDLSTFTPIIKYVDQSNIAHSEVLSQDSELYKGKVKFTFPIDTKITQFAGTVKLHITLSKTDLESGKQYVLHTGSYELIVDRMEDYFAYIPDETLEIIDQKIGQLDAQIQHINAIADTYNQTKADDLSYEENELQLLSNGLKIGKPVSIIGKEDIETIAKEQAISASKQYIDAALTIEEL